MGTVIVLAVLLLCCALAVWGLLRRGRKGRGDCASCPLQGMEGCGENRCPQ